MSILKLLNDSIGYKLMICIKEQQILCIICFYVYIDELSFALCSI